MEQPQNTGWWGMIKREPGGRSGQISERPGQGPLWRTAGGWSSPSRRMRTPACEGCAQLCMPLCSIPA